MLGIQTASATWNTRADLCINQAALELAVDSKTALNTRAMTGSAFGSLTPGADGVKTAGSASITFAGETFLSKYVYRGDVLDLNGQWFTINKVSDAALDVGIPVIASGTVTASGITIYRRSLRLPGNYLIRTVYLMDNNGQALQDELDPNPLAAVIYANQTGNVATWYSLYDQELNATVVQVYPAPTQATYLQVSATDFPAELVNDTDDLDWPRPALLSLLQKARELMLAYAQVSDPVTMGRAMAQRVAAADGFTKTSAPRPFFSR